MSNCFRKKNRSEKDARAYALSLTQQGPIHSNIKAYKCREGEHWHVGHKNDPCEAKEVLNRLEMP